MNRARALQLYIHDELFGYLIGLNDGKNILHFDTLYKDNPKRKTLSLLTLADNNWMITPKKSTFVLSPLLSNLLPEGSLRELISTNLKISKSNEFDLLCALGNDLPGAVTAKEVSIDYLPKYLQEEYSDTMFETSNIKEENNKFSLAGVQMKYSMIEADGRFTLSSESTLGDWIVKTPSNLYKDVPLNEYSCMRLAQLAGVDTPEIKLVNTKNIAGLSNIKIPDEKYAYAIRRFDRESQNNRIHIEDFAQILYMSPNKKYDSANYITIGKLIYKFSNEPLEDIQQYMKRLLINIFLGNGDAHLKNWSLIYPDMYKPKLSPAYDIVSTIAYIENDSLALNLAKTKGWQDLSLESFRYVSDKIGFPFRAISHHLQTTIELVKNTWHQELDKLPMNELHKDKLRNHWQSLHKDFNF